jgi:glycosyltransferase involved in cell wall biosynthesis
LNSRSLVSVCVPTFNGAEHLESCIKSIISQNYPNIEVVFSDDGSSDQTVKFIEQFAAAVSFPVKLLHHRRTTLAGNWNNCVANASGDYIKFLFQDDLMRPDCISRLVAVAERDPDVVLVFSPREIIYEGVKVRKSPALDIVENYAVLHRGWSELGEVQQGAILLADPSLLNGVWNKIGEPSTVLLRKQGLIDVGGFDPNLCQLLDLDMWYRLMAVGSVGFVDEVLSSFRVHEKQVSVENTVCGKARNDCTLFARKVVQSPIFDMVHPAARKKFRRASKEPSLFKVQRRKFKHWLSGICSRS